MKKTLTTTVLLLGLSLASAQADVLNTSTFTVGSTAADGSGVTITNTSDTLVLSYTSLSGLNTGGSTYNPNLVYTANGSDDLKSILTPNHNIGNATGKSWTLTFTLTNNGTEAITINSVDLGMVGTKSNGTQAQGTNGGLNNSGTSNGTSWNATNEGWIDATATNNKPITISLDDSSLVYNLASTSLTDVSTGTYDVDWTIEAGSSLTFTVTAANTPIYTSGCFAGIKSITFNSTTAAIPEPATATLSLLALAGLAARRRRK